VKRRAPAQTGPCPGPKNQPEQASARTPLSALLSFSFLFLFTLTGGPHLSAPSSPSVTSSTGNRRRWFCPLFSPLFPCPFCHAPRPIKTPSPSSSIPLCFFVESSTSYREIPRRNPKFPPPDFFEFRRHSKPRCLTPVPNHYPRSCAPLQPLLRYSLTAYRWHHQHPKHIGAPRISSRCPPPIPKAIDDAGHTGELAPSFRAPSMISPVPETTGAHRRSTTSAPRRICLSEP
jgi:hypothetical protein